MLRFMGGFFGYAMPIALTDTELDVVLAAARPLQVEDRDPFLRDVAERLAALPQLGDGLVFQICRVLQAAHWTPPAGLELTPLPRKYE
jgi:hypothetical protein